MILNDKDLQLLNTMPGSEQAKKDPELKIEFDGTTVLCRVCGDKASGFHYGVHSCEGCKGFFRRSIQQKIQYRPCTKNQQCSILRVNRNRCQYCRLKKCIAVGMSRDAVRFGRVPKREKAKILAAMQSVNARCQEKALAVELEDEAKLVGTIIKAHDDTCDYTKEKIGPLLQRARANPVYTQCTPQLACPLNPNPRAMHIGNQRVLEDFSERFSPAIRGVVEFAKRIPGFGLLSQDDQVTLLKAGVFEVLLVRLACMFDSRTNTMVCLNGQVLKRESLQHTSNARFLMDSMFDFAERLNMLQLIDSELGLFCAMVVIAPDRPGLRNIELVKRMQGKMMEALDSMVAHNHPQSPSMFQELMKKIPDLRTLNTLHSEKLLAFKMEPHTEQSATPSSAATTTTTTTTNMHAIYQTQVGHWGTYGGGLSHKGSHDTTTTTTTTTTVVSEDSKGSWEDHDHLVPSPTLLHRRSGSSEVMSWSPSTEAKDGGGSGGDLYGSPRSTDAAGYLIDDVGSSSSSSSSSSKSPMGGSSSSRGDGESGGEMTHHMPEILGKRRQEDHNHHHQQQQQQQQHQTPPTSHHHHQQQHHHQEGGSSSGDEGSAVGSPGTTKCPYKMRKLDSPTDSGIESGKELGSSSSSGTQSRSTSICSSPRSSLDDKVKDISDCEASDKQESIEDMPVLKRALQAPPLINTNLLMDEAYKPHKKFRALRKDSEATATSLDVAPPNAAASSPQQHPSLASTHSTLVKSLEQVPRMSEQQLKRTDIIHNIIMRTEASLSQGASSPAKSTSSSYTPVPATSSGLLYGCPQVSIAGPGPAAFTSGGAAATVASKGAATILCSPGYYIPQTGAGTAASATYPPPLSTNSWPPGFLGSSSTPSSQGGVRPYAAVSPSQQQQSPLALPRMYYNPRTATSASPTTLATAPQSPSATSQGGGSNSSSGTSQMQHLLLHHHHHHHHQQQHRQASSSSSSSFVVKPTSPVAGLVVEHLNSAPLSNGSHLARGENQQPLNLSKKVASPPPSLHILEAALLSQAPHRVKLESL